MGQQLDNELNMYQRISNISTRHPGKRAIRQLLGHFDISGPDGNHRCLVHLPLWDSILTILYRNPVARLPEPVLAFVMYRLFLALDFLHTECKIIHTDIKADNIFMGINDDSVFTTFEEEDMQHPTARKVVDDGRIIYQSREIPPPKNAGAPVLGDFGAAVPGDIEHTEDVQPDIYRAPEVILESKWSSKIDIWNAGCMIWDIFEGGHLFTGRDPSVHKYRSRAHLAEMIALLGPPPQKMLDAGDGTHKYFVDGKFRNDIPIPERVSLADKETNLKGDDKELFLALMNKMLQWDPEKQFSAKDLAEDEWLHKYM